ncbi:MAG: molybdopterin molybdotransferase MoeA, partial [Actinomycetia bacterium]|nr:molybdopterin molybdotransferase MoeA [Actinomycetes bacterium]
MTHDDNLMTVERYRERLLGRLGGWPRTETVAPALGRVLASDVVARVDVPRFANAAMDGFGFAYAGSGDAYAVVGEVPAGTSSDAAVGPGQAVRIMTGAPVPPGVDTVVPLEDARTEGDVVRFVRARPGQHVRAAGEDVRRGDVVVRAGTRLSARHLAACAAVGVAEVMVAVAPRVGVVTTGDELTPAGRPLAHLVAQTPPLEPSSERLGVPAALSEERSGGGDVVGLGAAGIFDSNGPYLAAAVTQAGGRVVWASHSGDDADALRTALDGAVGAGADLVLVSGGVSAGDRDVTRALLAAEGDGEFVRLAMQPGKPQGYGTWRGVLVVGLPGNPVSTAATFAVFVRPLLETMLGASSARTSWGVVAQGWRSPAGRRQYIPVSVTPVDDATRAIRPATPGGSGSHLVASLASADA